jgi:hypothetical protein
MQVASAQDSVNLPLSQPTNTAVLATSSNVSPGAASQPASNTTTSDNIIETPIMDYKSVYEAATLEEEVQMATERFNLTKSQQEVWANAAVDRRETEKQARVALEAKNKDLNKDAVYRGLRNAQSQFYETITGYFEPSQKQLLEKDRIIIEEKRKMIAKLPPPVITPTVAPVDSTAIKAEMEKAEKDKKAKARAKRKKKTVGT